MTKVKYILIALCGLFAVAGCMKEDRENTIIGQEAAIDSYISRFTDNKVERNGGSNRVVVEEAPESAAVAEAGDSLYVIYSGYVFSNGPGTLFVTNNPETAQARSFPLQETPMKMLLGGGNIVQGLEQGLYGVGEGEHSYIVFSAKYGFNNNVVGTIPKLAPMFYEIWVERVIKN